jgi:hypothetical protein
MLNNQENFDKIRIITATLIGFLTIIIGIIIIFSMFFFGDKSTGTIPDNSLNKLLDSKGIKTYDISEFNPANNNGGKK